MSQFGRLERKPSTPSTLWYNPSTVTLKPQLNEILVLRSSSYNKFVPLFFGNNPYFFLCNYTDEHNYFSLHIQSKFNNFHINYQAMQIVEVYKLSFSIVLDLSFQYRKTL